MFWGCLEDVFARRLEDVLKTSWRHFEDVCQDEYIGLHQDVLKTSSEDVWVRQIIFVLIRTSWKRLLKSKTKDIFKMSSRRLQQDECLLSTCNSTRSKNAHTSHLKLMIYLSIMPDHFFKTFCRIRSQSFKIFKFRKHLKGSLVSSIRTYQITASVWLISTFSKSFV